MPNSNSPASRQARQRTANARRAAVIAEGGMQLNVLLERPAADDLRELIAQGETKQSVISRALRLALSERGQK